MRMSLRELLIVVAVAAVGLAGLKFASSGMLPIVQAMTGLLLLVFVVRAIVDRGPAQAFALGVIACSVAYLVSLLPFTETGVRTPVSAFGTEWAIDRFYAFVKANKWVAGDSIKSERDIQPTANEISAGWAKRIELAPLPPEVEQKLIVEKTKSDGGQEVATATDPPQAARGRGASGYETRIPSGRRGRGTATVVAQLTPEQTAEYNKLSQEQREEFNSMVVNPKGLTAVLSGRPLSSIKQFIYKPQDIPSYREFQVVGYCLWTLAVGYAGGHFARYVYTRRLRPDSADARRSE